jgi:hypothetical protein
MQGIQDPEPLPELVTPTEQTIDVESEQLRAARLLPLSWAARFRYPSPALRQALALFGVTRLLLVLVTYFGYVLFNAGKYSPDSVGVTNLLFSWNRWDALWYEGIARSGYQSPTATAFFPLYPLLIRLGTLPFGSDAAYVVGLLVSNIAFFFLLWTLRVLAEQECGPEVASRATLYLAVFPTALFFFAPYNESLFVLLAVLCFLALRRERWWLAGLLGLLAALTRSAGIFLAVPFLVEYGSRHGWQWRRLRLDGLAIALIPLGLALYSVYCWLQFGDPLAFSHAQTHWGRELKWPWVGIWNQMLLIWHAQPASFFQAHDLLDLAATLGVIALVVLGWRRLPLSYSLYAVVLLATFLLFPLAFSDTLEANQRFALEVFPAFMTLGLLVRRLTTHQAVVILFTGLLALLSLVFMTGRWLV